MHGCANSEAPHFVELHLISKKRRLGGGDRRVMEKDQERQLYTDLFERLEDFCAGDELAEVSDVEYVVYEEDDGKVVERGRI